MCIRSRRGNVTHTSSISSEFSVGKNSLPVPWIAALLWYIGDIVLCSIFSFLFINSKIIWGRLLISTGFTWMYKTTLIVSPQLWGRTSSSCLTSFGWTILVVNLWGHWLHNNDFHVCSWQPGPWVLQFSDGGLLQLQPSHLP